MTKIITNSSAKAFKNCRKAYQFRNIDELVPKGTSKSLVQGTAVHSALQALYKGFKKLPVPIGVNEAKSFVMGRQALIRPCLEEVFGEVTDMEEEQIQLLMSTSQAMVNEYLRMWLVADYQTFDEYYPELMLTAPIVTPKGRKVVGWQYAGVLDGLVKFNGNWWIVENKTTGERDINDYKEQLIMDYQSTGYIYLATSFLGVRPVGVMYNVMRKPMLQQRVSESMTDFCERIRLDYNNRPEFYIFREHIFRNDWENDEFQKELYQIYKDMRTCEHYYRNTSQCSSYAGCGYRPMCRGFLDESAIMQMFKKEAPHSELARHTQNDSTNVPRPEEVRKQETAQDSAEVGS